MPGSLPLHFLNSISTAHVLTLSGHKHMQILIEKSKCVEKLSNSHIALCWGFSCCSPETRCLSYIYCLFRTPQTSSGRLSNLHYILKKWQHHSVLFISALDEISNSKFSGKENIPEIYSNMCLLSFHCVCKPHFATHLPREMDSTGALLSFTTTSTPFISCAQ